MADLRIVNRRRARNVRTGRLEVWEAESSCGDWFFERTDESGTPWVASHRPSRWWGLYGSLRKAALCAPRQLGLDLANALANMIGGGR